MTPVGPFIKAARPDDGSSRRSDEIQNMQEGCPMSKENDNKLQGRRSMSEVKQESAESNVISPKCPSRYDSQTFKLGPFNCLICQELLFESSRCVPCTHVFCKACISRFNDCPLCGAGIEKIEADNNLQSVVDRFVDGDARIKRSPLDLSQPPQETGEEKAARKGKEPAKKTIRQTIRWTPGEETLLAKCYVAVSENNQKGKDQTDESFWYKVHNEFNKSCPQTRTKDMLTGKWAPMNTNCQKFNAIYKRLKRLSKTGENEVNLLARVRQAYRDDSKTSKPFTQDDVWQILRKHPKWDAVDHAVDPADLTGHAELFGDDSRVQLLGKPRVAKKSKSETSSGTTTGSCRPDFTDTLQNEFRLKREAAQSAYEVAKEKDQTIMRLKELKFLAISTLGLPEEDAKLINMQKEVIRRKYRRGN